MDQSPSSLFKENPQIVVTDDNFNEIEQQLSSVTHLEADITIKTIGRLPNLSHLHLDGHYQCTELKLTSLEGLPKSYNALYCSFNRLRSIPPLPDQLKSLYCEGNRLETLPELPDRLLTLNCRLNPISTLPALPESLLRLDCGITPIATPLQYPEHLELLNISGSSIPDLPELPPNLEMLFCEATTIPSIPNLPPSLILIRCHENQLNRFHSLPPEITIKRDNTPHILASLCLKTSTLVDRIQMLISNFNEIVDFHKHYATYLEKENGYQDEARINHQIAQGIKDGVEITLQYLQQKEMEHTR